MLTALMTALLMAAAPQATEEDAWVSTFELCHTANAGFYATELDTGVLFDTVIEEGLMGYNKVSTPVLEDMIAGRGKFDDVKVALVSHHHKDHFDAGATIRHLRANPNVTYVMPPQAYNDIAAIDPDPALKARIQTPLPEFNNPKPIKLTISGVEVTVFRVSHGPNRPIENLGYLVKLPDDTTLFHTGDIVANLDQLVGNGLLRQPVTFLLPTFWTFLDNDDAMEAVGLAFDPLYIVPNHFLSTQQDWMKPHGGPDEIKTKVFSAIPNAIRLTGEMECWAELE